MARGDETLLRSQLKAVLRDWEATTLDTVVQSITLAQDRAAVQDQIEVKFGRDYVGGGVAL